MIKKSAKLDHVCYDIRGPALDEARRLEEEGQKLLRLNIGNPAPFGLNAPGEILWEMTQNLNLAQGYSDSKGIPSAREAIVKYCMQKGIGNITIEDVYIGNGVSELIVMAMQGLLNNGDEILVPAPDYPLWTAAVNLSGGTPIHYLCDEESSWYPDLEDLERKITDKTKGIVIINPNNPTGALYPVDILEKIVRLAHDHDLIIFSDEIYDKILYDDAQHTSTASLSDDVLFVTFNGLSKSHRIAGFRVGWMVISGKKDHAKSYIEGLHMLASMRLCSNVPAQLIIHKALDGHQSIEDHIKPGGRIREQRDYAYESINNIPGVSCVKPQGAFYLFPKLDMKRFNIKDDQKFILDLVRQEKVLVVQGTGFNWPLPDHFRIVFLPSVEELKTAMGRLSSFLDGYKQK